LMTVGYCPQSLALDYPTQLSSREDAQAEIRLPELNAAKMNAEAAMQMKKTWLYPFTTGWQHERRKNDRSPEGEKVHGF
jgi:hypothetical protein